MPFGTAPEKPLLSNSGNWGTSRHWGDLCPGRGRTWPAGDSHRLANADETVVDPTLVIIETHPFRAEEHPLRPPPADTTIRCGHYGHPHTEGPIVLPVALPKCGLTGAPASVASTREDHLPQRRLSATIGKGHLRCNRLVVPRGRGHACYGSPRPPSSLPGPSRLCPRSMGHLL